MSEWLKGLIAGVISTLIGFGLTMVWDIVRFRREAKQRDESVLSAVKGESLTNLDILRGNQALLKQELAILDKNQRIVGPLLALRTGSWDVLRINLPKKLVREPQSLIKISEISTLTDRVNEFIRSRENFRIHNGAMTNFSSYIRIYDEALVKQNEALEKGLEDLKALLE